MSAENPHQPNQPNGDLNKTLGLSPSDVEFVQGLNDQIDQASLNAASAVASAEGVAASSEENHIGIATELTMLGGLMNIMREPNPAVADAEDIVEGEAHKIAHEVAVQAAVATLSSIIMNDLAAQIPPLLSTTDQLVGIRAEAERRRRQGRPDGAFSKSLDTTQWQLNSSNPARDATIRRLDQKILGRTDALFNRMRTERDKRLQDKLDNNEPPGPQGEEPPKQPEQ